jgi:hypothetical protein
MHQPAAHQGTDEYLEDAPLEVDHLFSSQVDGVASEQFELIE